MALTFSSTNRLRHVENPTNQNTSFLLRTALIASNPLTFSSVWVRTQKRTIEYISETMQSELNY